MALDRWIALVLLLLCGIYGYAAFFTMDQLLPPFMQRNPVWPSTFPKVLSVMGALTALMILVGLEKPSPDPSEKDIDHTRLGDYQIGRAAGLLALMVAYALLLRPAGFLSATAGFLIGGAAILGERRWFRLVGIAAVAAIGVWYLVQQVLGIFLSPLPAFL